MSGEIPISVVDAIEIDCRTGGDLQRAVVPECPIAVGSGNGSLHDDSAIVFDVTHLEKTTVLEHVNAVGAVVDQLRIVHQKEGSLDDQIGILLQRQHR